VYNVKELLEQGRTGELWQMCCGFLDLTLEQFMAIQKQLMLEQIGFLKHSALGRKVMLNVMPNTIEEFREQIPFTTYKDYCPELLEKREDCLPAKPARWMHTSGKSGEYPFKWIPVSQRAWEELTPVICAGRILASCKNKGEVNIYLNAKLLFATAPAPYMTGVIACKMEEEFGFKYFPSPQDSEKLSFTERIDKGFWQALSEGIDGFYGLPSILLAIGERFKEGAGSVKPLKLLSRPRAFFRLARGVIRSKKAKRPMLPKDLWKLKAISSAGTDSIVYRKKIEEMWGLPPFDIYGGTESLVVAMQTWDRTNMTFIPNLNFFEFIPEEEHFKWQMDHSYKPKTVLLDEVKAGENYEIVITNFHGNALVRFKVGDMIKITSLRNEKTGVNIPQMAFERRADDLIDLGLLRLTEKIIWQAIENTGIPYRDWTARKEIVDGNPTLNLYLELKDSHAAMEYNIAEAIFEQIQKLDDGFIHKDLDIIEKLINLKPIKVTLLQKGAFGNYLAQRQAEGADLAHLKPPHINPSDKILTLLKANIETPHANAIIHTQTKAKSSISH
jgi:hypothetical protein